MNQERTLSKLKNYDLFRVTQPLSLKKTRKSTTWIANPPASIETKVVSQRYIGAKGGASNSWFFDLQFHLD